MSDNVSFVVKETFSPPLGPWDCCLYDFPFSHFLFCFFGMGVKVMTGGYPSYSSAAADVEDSFIFPFLLLDVV